ncbi:MAG: hypothetical protein ACI9WU_001607 [Myxococcota bacterium]|jgi:hypothetical protein
MSESSAWLAAHSALQSAGVLGGDWRLELVRRTGSESLRLELGPGRVLHWSALSAEPVGELSLAGRHWRCGAAVQRGADRAQLVLLRKACAALARLGPDVGVCIASTPERSEPLAAHIVNELLARLGPPAPDWDLIDQQDQGVRDVALTFRARNGRTLTVLLRPRSESPAFARTRDLDVAYSATHGQAESDCRRLAGAVASQLERVESDVCFAARPAIPVADRPAAALNLALPAPCGQRCSFCSLDTDRSPATAVQIAGWTAAIRRAASAGTRTLRLNGIEPLNAPYLFDLLTVARDSGFERFSVLSTCRPLADAAFAARFIEAAPERYDISIPLYGALAETHDAVTGVAGAFAQILAAVANLREHARKGGVFQFTTVITRQNVHELAALRDLTQRLGGDWRVHLPFPNTAQPDGRYAAGALSMTAVLEALYPPGEPRIVSIPLGEVVPCVALAHQRRTGHALITEARLGAAQRHQAGTYYRDAAVSHASNSGGDVAYTAATMACPHTGHCALASACPGRVYAQYAESFGLAELAPVSDADVASLSS